MRTVILKIHRGAPIGVAAILVAVACSDSPPEQSEPLSSWSIGSAEVLFTGRRDGLSDLYVHDRATGQSTRLTTFGTPEGGANAGRVSSGGHRVAFQVRRGSDYEIHVMDRVGGRSQNITNHPDYDVNPAWSPDARQVAFMSTRGVELGSIGPFPGHIYVRTLDADSLRQVTKEPLTSPFGPSDWSSDGNTMLMARDYGDGPDVYELDVLSGAEVRLTDSAAGEYSATFSHSGDRIAFHAESDTGSQIVLLDLSTRERHVLTTGPGYRYSPKWSPDDQWLLFTASDDGDQYDIRAVHVSNGAVLEIVATDEDEREGEWLPGGS